MACCCGPSFACCSDVSKIPARLTLAFSGFSNLRCLSFTSGIYSPAFCSGYTLQSGIDAFLAASFVLAKVEELSNRVSYRLQTGSQIPGTDGTFARAEFSCANGNAIPSAQLTRPAETNASAFVVQTLGYSTNAYPTLSCLCDSTCSLPITLPVAVTISVPFWGAGSAAAFAETNMTVSAS